MVVGEALIASIIACRPPSMRLAISISPSRVSSSTVPISRMYMRTGSVVRPNSVSTVDSAASAASSASSSVAVGRAAAGDQQRRRIGRLLVDRDAHVVEHRDDGFEDLVVDQLLGQVVVDLLVRQEAARLAHLDERLELLAALGDLFLGQRGLVEAELAHQRALLGARDLHAQRLGLDRLFALARRLLDLGLAFELGLDVGEVDVVGGGGLLGSGPFLPPLAALGSGLAGAFAAGFTGAFAAALAARLGRHRLARLGLGFGFGLGPCIGRHRLDQRLGGLGVGGSLGCGLGGRRDGLGRRFGGGLRCRRGGRLGSGLVGGHAVPWAMEGGQARRQVGRARWQVHGDGAQARACRAGKFA